MRRRIVMLVVVISIVLIYTIFTVDTPKSIDVIYESGFTADLQQVKVKNIFGITIAKTQFPVIDKGQYVSDTTLSYKVTNDTIEVETFEYGGILSYSIDNNNFDESTIETKTEIDDPTGQLEFPNEGYIGGQHRTIKL